MRFDKLKEYTVPLNVILLFKWAPTCILVKLLDFKDKEEVKNKEPLSLHRK